MTPLKPVSGSFTPTLPRGWTTYFIPLLNDTPDNDLVAGFCGRFLAALNGNEDAFRSICNVVAHLGRLPQDRLTAAEKRHIANMLQLSKLLADRHDRQQERNSNQK